MKIMNMRKGSWGKLTAFFDVATDEGFIIKGFKLVNGINGFFVGFPSQKGNDDEYHDTIWLTENVRESLREKLNTMAVDEYNKDNPAEPVADSPNESATSTTSPPTTSSNDVEASPPTTSSNDVEPAEEQPFSQDDLPF